MIKSPIPLLIDPLKLVGMPSLGEAQEDLHQGFQVVGTIHQGSGCLPRAESRYEFPLSPEACAENNKRPNYVVGMLTPNGQLRPRAQVRARQALMSLLTGGQWGQPP